MITTHEIISKAQALNIAPRLLNNFDIEKIAERLHITTSSLVETINNKDYHITTLNLAEALQIIDWLKVNRIEWATEL